MKTKKMLLTGISLLTAIGLIGTPAAFAASDTTSIVNSGDNAQVTTSSNSTTDVNISNTNMAEIQQQIQSRVNTGNNNADRNISTGGSAGTMIDTGNAASSVGLDVQANKNETAIAIGGSGDMNWTDIVNTGNDADIDSSANSQTNVNVQNQNQARIRQVADLVANSGNNSADRNVGSGPSIMTGNAGTSVGLNTAVNSNTTAIAVGTDPMSSASALSSSDEGNFTSIVNTGNDLDSDTSVNTRTRIRSTSMNSMNVMQQYMSRVNTGGNDSDRNVGGASQSTGVALTQVETSAHGNYNNSFFGDLFDILMFWN